MILNGLIANRNDEYCYGKNYIFCNNDIVKTLCDKHHIFEIISNIKNKNVFENKEDLFYYKLRIGYNCEKWLY